MFVGDVTQFLYVMTGVVIVLAALAIAAAGVSRRHFLEKELPPRIERLLIDRGRQYNDELYRAIQCNDDIGDVPPRVFNRVMRQLVKGGKVEVICRFPCNQQNGILYGLSEKYVAQVPAV